MEVLSLLFTGTLVWLSALVQHLNTGMTRGPRFALSDRSQPLSDDGFSGRASRTLRNNMESGLMYVPVAAALILLHGQNDASALVAITYVIARGIFTIAYWFRINLLRTGAWLVGMVAIALQTILVTETLWQSFGAAK